MTNTFALTDYDLYEDQYFDSFNRKKRKNRFRRRSLSVRKDIRKPGLSRPPYRSIPRVIKGKPTKLPPIVVKKIAVIKNVVRKPKVILKKKKPALVKPKTPIQELIKKSHKQPMKPSLSKEAALQLQAVEKKKKEDSKKGKPAASKTVKIIKVLAIMGALGVSGFGVYKFLELRKSNTNQ